MPPPLPRWDLVIRITLSTAAHSQYDDVPLPGRRTTHQPRADTTRLQNGPFPETAFFLLPLATEGKSGNIDRNHSIQSTECRSTLERDSRRCESISLDTPENNPVSLVREVAHAKHASSPSREEDKHPGNPGQWQTSRSIITPEVVGSSARLPPPSPLIPSRGPGHQ